MLKICVGTPFRVLVTFAVMAKNKFQPSSIDFVSLSSEVRVISILSLCCVDSDNHKYPVDYAPPSTTV